MLGDRRLRSLNSGTSPACAFRAVALRIAALCTLIGEKDQRTVVCLDGQSRVADRVSRGSVRNWSRCHRPPARTESRP